MLALVLPRLAGRSPIEARLFKNLVLLFRGGYEICELCLIGTFRVALPFFVNDYIIVDLSFY